MKKLSKVLFFIVLALGINCAANAQSQKIGYVDSQVIIDMMPEGAKIEQDLQAFYGELQTELQAMVTEYQNKMRDYEANQATMSNILRGRCRQAQPGQRKGNHGPSGQNTRVPG